MVLVWWIKLCISTQSHIFKPHIYIFNENSYGENKIRNPLIIKNNYDGNKIENLLI